MPHELLYYSQNKTHKRKQLKFQNFRKRLALDIHRPLRPLDEKIRVDGTLSSGMFSVYRFGIYKAQIMITT